MCSIFKTIIGKPPVGASVRVRPRPSFGSAAGSAETRTWAPGESWPAAG